jgi:ubiquinone biosynthesis monooxygenase Coq7
MVRVDHAGEYGAKRIYQGQLAVLGTRSASGRKIRHMAEQEQRHLETFERLIVERRVRPTALHPLWHVAGFALGAATALMGTKAAMACTIAVEEVIDDHYRRQSELLGSQTLGSDETALKAHIDEFRGEEAEHRATAEAAGGREITAYPLLAGAVKAGSRLAIWLSERV